MIRRIKIPTYTSAVSKKLIPALNALFKISICISSWSLAPVIQFPKPRIETLKPELPKYRYSMCSLRSGRGKPRDGAGGDLTTV